MPLKKLIETSIPISIIDRESEREKTARGGMPSNVHIWWTRQPLTVSRSLLFTSLVDDPSGHPELFPTKEAQVKERDRLISIASKLAKVESIDDSKLIDAAKEELYKYNNGELPIVFDPFVGGGSVPVEAQRLGLKSVSSDLNPVAVMITRMVSDIPTRFSETIPVHPRDSIMMEFPIPGAGGLAEDIKYYGELVLEKTKEEIGYLYPTVISPDTGKEQLVSAWIWARTVKCPNPTCGCEIPLSSSYDLSKKKGSEAWVEPYISNGSIQFRIHHSPNVSEKGKPKVAQTAVFKCPVCGEITPDAYVKECGQKHQMQNRLIAIVSDSEKKRLYLSPSAEQEAIASIDPPAVLPHGKLPNFPKRFSPPSFGLTDYSDLFTDRQLVFITTIIDKIKAVQKIIELAAIDKGFPDDGISFIDGGSGAIAYAESIRMALVLTVSKLLDRCSNLCSWSSSSGGSLRNVFSRAAMPMIWDYAEANPFAAAGGSFSNALSRTCDAIAKLPVGRECTTFVHNGTDKFDIENALICTDLPYYDKASYSDLSDFFYIWLRFGLQDLFPNDFSNELTSKTRELTAFPHRWNGDKKQANAAYSEKLRSALKCLYDCASVDYPSTIGFQYLRNSSNDIVALTEWEDFITSLYEVGFDITASWPLGKAGDESTSGQENKAIPISVIVRKRPKDSPQITRRLFVASVKHEMPEIIQSLSKIVDHTEIRAASIGRALNIFTRNNEVLDADGSAMKMSIASRIIEQEMDTILFSNEYTTMTNTNPNEEETNNVRES